MQYGYFDDANFEYVVTTPKTPLKWINYIGTLSFGGFVDHTGGALLCKGDPAFNRITKYIPQLPSSNFKGTTLYIRTKKADGSYDIFSPFFVPTLNKYDSFECRVGLGYNKWTVEANGFRVEVTVFIPLNANQEIRDIRVTNIGSDAVEVDVIPVVEYTHFDALKQYTNADWIPQTMQCVKRDDGDGLLTIIQYAFMRAKTHHNFITSNYPVASFETDRLKFLGDNEYGTWADPHALKQESLSNYETLRGDNITALLHALGTVAPNETKQVITQFGQCNNIENIQDEIAKYRNPVAVEEAKVAMAEFWRSRLTRFQAETPSAAMNTMLNIHNPRQCYITMNWSRYLSLYQLGLGARGIGFRDTSQDVMGVVGIAPEESKALIRQLLHVQKRDGSAMHQFNPITMIANEGDSREEAGRSKFYGDDHLWIVFTTMAYIKETGDFGLLQEEIPFYEKDENNQPIEVGTIWDHLNRSLDFTFNNVGQHGLPLLGFADWNDTVNLTIGAESCFVANQFGVAINELSEWATYIGDTEALAKYKTYYDTMKERINEHAWDGEWYIRYFDNYGDPIGSHLNEQGKIYTNGQSWPVLSGFATEERAQQALDSVYKHLNTSKGIKLSTPGYNGYNEHIGGVSTYPPGAKENGGIFLHSNPWVMIAETLMGNGNRAFEYYNQINPASKNDILDEYEAEPFVYAQNILGDEHPQFGLARNSWLSGTSSWTYQAGTKWILGIRPQIDGLLIDPCIPNEWDGFTVRRQFRGGWYNISVINPNGVSKGVTSMSVNGKAVDGNTIPVLGTGEHTIDVVMG